MQIIFEDEQQYGHFSGRFPGMEVPHYMGTRKIRAPAWAPGSTAGDGQSNYEEKYGGGISNILEVDLQRILMLKLKNLHIFTTFLSHFTLSTQNNHKKFT